MALKSYHRETLNDNWYEERAESLNGVLPRDGVKEFKTTHATDFNGAQPIIPRQKLRMISDNNIDEAIRQTASLDWSRGFRSVLPVPDPEPDRGMISTQHRVHVNHFASSKPSFTSTAGVMIAAGGPGGRAVERGKAVSGAMGEVYKKSSEPQRDTLAQRSWMYSTDPMIVVRQKREALEATKFTTPPEPQQGNKTVNYGRQITAITSIRHHHKGVFVDDEPGYPQ
ncbi:hypothetical protein F442_11977 [Phytophthora nicotianae P10297]|uniref:Uncharacterized protein n=3 Tax=Phytophthora nicotianae TaxID=4792 RepID=W2Q277_PHYN3|nr:hypothetical protein PPTG_13710 [Phytophthora nicotianae INRA-310]ETL89524.1 hypothetical protein L917_11568 [Phytophthora nicotianae]ETN06365.1 hypothetical protein PPTG_13710 [Phytophthora nicotianae INRA-310]ETP40748.1 hypothetical protein F442_11977 [Phytophthora nicotianae P10297]KUF85256.1 hypothetical protein AM587_10002904 [Phytophthora nicotianae]